MAIEIIMPKLGMTMTTGTLVRWLCQDGESVEAGQVVCEVESEKLNTEVTADVEGIVKLVAQEGDEVAVGGRLAEIEPAVGAVVRSRSSQAEQSGSAVRKVTANGIQLNVSSFGEGEPLILIHGLASSMGLWAALDQDKLAGRTVISYDLRGHGGSERPAGAHTLAKHVADLVGLMEALAIPQADLVGHSLGGMIALELAASQPERVRSLTLVSSAAAFPPATREALFELASTVSFSGSGAVADQLINWSFSPAFRAANPKMVETIRHSIKSSDAASLAAAARMVAKIDLQPRLALVKAPTLVLVGEQDELAPPALSQALQAGIAGATLHPLPNCGHAAPLEQPGLVTEQIVGLVLA